MKHRLFNLSLFVLVALAMLISACAPSSSLPAVPTMQAPAGLNPVAILNGARAYYNRGITDFEQPGNVARANADMTKSRMMTTIRTLATNQKNCTINGAAMEETIAKAVMGHYSPEQIGSALINAQALTVGSVSGEQAATVCAELSKQIADYTISIGPEFQNDFMKQYQIYSGYKAYLSNYPELKTLNDLMQIYGDMSLVNQKLNEYNMSTGTDITWLPTKDNVFVQTSNKKLVDYYRTGAFMADLPPTTIERFKGHEKSLRDLYEASWNEGTGTGMLYRMAAIDYNLTLPLAPDSTNNTMPDDLLSPTK